MKIGQLADATGVSTSSIRFYEKHGLIPRPTRQDNGYRDYPDEMVSRLHIIAMSKALGFSLSEIRRFLPDDPADNITRADAIANLETKLVDVDGKIKNLREIRKNLEEMLKHLKDPNAKAC
ncbi:MAG: MerR family transcriptional regulator [Pseudomonadota bacterium]